MEWFLINTFVRHTPTLLSANLPFKQLLLNNKVVIFVKDPNVEGTAPTIVPD